MLEKRFVKGVSPVAATVLLVVITIIIALIIFLWFRGLKGETCFKFEQNIELVCRDAEFLADYNPDTDQLYVSNTGNIPIFGMKIKIDKTTRVDTFDLSEFGFPGTGLNPGDVFSSDQLGAQTAGAESITLIPLLLGSCGREGEKTYMCREGDYGYKIDLN